MRGTILKTAIIAGAILAVLGIPFGVMSVAAVKGDPLSKGNFGAVNVLNSAATAIPATNLKSRNAISIYNNGPNTIWCGFRSNVTSTTGYPVASARALSLDIVSMDDGAPVIYCIADTADQASPANTRFLEVK